MISDAQRIPIWLREEIFSLRHSPKQRPPILVTIWDNDGMPFEGRGFSIAEAAKEARKKREGK